ncbi:MAG: hypothetical protein P8129_18645 [Anaerolineae bacterium]
MLDLSGIQEEARPIVRRAAGVYRKHTAPWFIGLVVHGSAVKGGVIPGCSDLDMQLYLEPEALSWHGHLPLDLAFAIRRDLEGIELWPFRYLQCYTCTAEMPEGWVGPIPGAYRLVAGRLPVAEATAEDVRRAAARGLGGLEAAPTYLVGKLLGPDGEPSRGGGGVRLARSLRLLCTQVWPALYQVLTLQEEDALAVWRLPKAEAVARLPEAGGLRAAGEAFHRAVRAYPTTRSRIRWRARWP